MSGKLQMSGEAGAVESPDAPPLDDGSYRDTAWVPAGTFRMRTDKHHSEEPPVLPVTVDRFWTNRTPVANRELRRFVAATGHVAIAEIAPDPADYPGALPHMPKPGLRGFTSPGHSVDLRNRSQCCRFTFGANWHRPHGQGKGNHRLDDHPVVHIVFADAEWVYAARHAQAVDTGMGHLRLRSAFISQQEGG